MRLATLLVVLLPAAAFADTRPDQLELDFGPTNVAATLGHGGLTAGVSSEGDLTVLRWPSPSYFDQMQYATTVAPGDLAPRAKPHFGAAETAGAFVGLYTEPGGLTWLRDTAWTHTVTYRNDDSVAVTGTYRNDALGISVFETSAVAPATTNAIDPGDILTRRYDVAVDVNRSYAVVRLVAFANFAPSSVKTANDPTEETSRDATRDLACVYSDAQRALVEFSPTSHDLATVAGLGATPSTVSVDAFLDGLGADHPGAYIVWGGDRTPTTWQCGADKAFPDPGPQDPLDDAVDGALSGSTLSTTHTDGALMWDVDVTGDSEVTLFFAVGASFADAQKLLGPARAAGAPAIADLSDVATMDFNSLAPMPGQSLQQLARRALLTIYTARDRVTGGIVSSVASQPPLHFDKTAEGAFLTLALDVSGHTDLALAHNRFYARAQRVAPQPGDTPAGSLASGYFTDGTVTPAKGATASGKATFPIDGLGFSLWMLSDHAKFLAGDTDRQTYLTEVYPNIKAAADLLTTCVDSKTNLPCLRQEGDTSDPQQTLRGAEAAYLGLFAAVKAAVYLGHTGDAARWQQRSFFLRAAIDQAVATSGAARGFLAKSGGYSGDQTARAIAIWPAQLHPFTDSRSAATAHALETEVGALVETTAAAAGVNPARALLGITMYEFREGGNDEVVQPRVRSWFTRLATMLRTPGTNSFGQASVFEGGAWDQRVGQPSATEAAFLYLAVMAVTDPRTVVRAEIERPVTPSSGFHCYARVAGQPARLPAAAVIGVGLVLVLWRRRRRRGAR